MPKVVIRNPKFYESDDFGRWVFCYAYLKDNELIELEFYIHTPNEHNRTQGLKYRSRTSGCKVVLIERSEVGT